jgi:hypothetical protein
MKRQASPFNCASMQATLKAQRDSLGKETKPHHYSNEVGLVRSALTGNSRADYDLANPPIGRKRITRHIICLNTSLIAEGVAFEQRKRICREIALKYVAQLLK